jgi:beta-lactamase class A
MGLVAVAALPLSGCAAAGIANGPGGASRDTAARQWSETLAGIERAAQGRLGVAMLDTGSGLALGWRQDERFAMASTFKVVLAGWMLALVDQGKERLDARVHYAATDVVAYSPVSGPRAGEGGGLAVGELCAATVSLSDNTAANVLLARHGGPAGLTAFVRSLGDNITRLDRTEPTLNEAAVGDPRDTTTPVAMLHPAKTGAGRCTHRHIARPAAALAGGDQHGRQAPARGRAGLDGGGQDGHGQRQWHGQ